MNQSDRTHQEEFFRNLVSGMCLDLVSVPMSGGQIYCAQDREHDGACVDAMIVATEESLVNLNEVLRFIPKVLHEAFFDEWYKLSTESPEGFWTANRRIYVRHEDALELIQNNIARKEATKL